MLFLYRLKSVNKFMEFSAKQIAELLNGEIIGNDKILVSDISKIEDGKSGTISFLANPKYEKFIYTTNASIVLVNKTFVPSKPILSTLIKVDNAYNSIATLLGFYDSLIKNKEGVSSLSFVSKSTDISQISYLGEFAFIGENVKIGKGVKIYPQVYVGDNVKIGENTTLYPGVKIYFGCEIGNNCVLNSGTIIGADGFGFAPQEETADYKKIPQVGNVVIEDNVDIGANSAIDRATMGSTIIHKGVKIDNFVQIAHNVEIGSNTVIAAHSGVSGSTKIGKNCMVAGQVGFAGHLTIGNNVKIAAQSGIGCNLSNNAVVQGSPAFNYRDYQKSSIYFRRLPDTNKRIETLEKEILELKTIISTIKN